MVDGTAATLRFLGTSRFRGDSIVRITPAGRLGDAPTKKRVDASGLVVALGFIDIQGVTPARNCSPAMVA